MPNSLEPAGLAATDAARTFPRAQGQDGKGVGWGQRAEPGGRRILKENKRGAHSHQPSAGKEAEEGEKEEGGGQEEAEEG